MSDLLENIKENIVKEEEYLKYTFLYKFNEVENWNYRPLRLNIQLTKFCNQNCISCNCGTKVNRKDELTSIEIKKIINQICNLYNIKKYCFYRWGTFN